MSSESFHSFSAVPFFRGRAISAIIAADRHLLRRHAPAGAGAGAGASGSLPAPLRISHRDILTFNAWIFNVRTLIAQVQLLDRRVDDLLVCQEPVDLRAISFV